MEYTLTHQSTDLSETFFEGGQYGVANTHFPRTNSPHSRTLEPVVKNAHIALCVWVAQSCPTLQPHELQHARPPCPSPSPGVHSNSHPSSQWCHPSISSSVVPFSSCPQSLPASGSFPKSQLFAWGGQNTGASALASFLPKNTQRWSPLEWTSWISLQSKGLSRVFSNTTLQKHQFFSAQLSSQSNSLTQYMTTGKTIALTRWTFFG